MAIPSTRHALLRAAGRALVAQEPVARADVIVISVDADGAGVLEAADLVHAGVATRVALFPDLPDVIDREFIRRGVPYHNAALLAAMQLRALGINSVEQIPWYVNGTTDESVSLKRWCLEKRFRSVVFVSTADHSRRTRRMFDRTMRGADTQVIVHYSRYSEFDPDKWWLTRNGIRIEVLETQKLLLDALLHPLS